MAKKNNADFLDKVAGGKKIGGTQAPVEVDEVVYSVYPGTNIDNPGNDPLVMVNTQLMHRSTMEHLNQPHEVDTSARRLIRTPRHEFLERFPNIEVYGNPPLGLN